MPELYLSPSPRLQGHPYVCSLQRYQAHTPGPPCQQGLSNSSHASPHSTFTPPLEGRHTEKLRFPKVQSVSRGTAPKCGPRLGPHGPAPGPSRARREQSASLPPSCHLLSTSSTQPLR